MEIPLGFWSTGVLLFTLLVCTESNPRRMRVKTISNITASTTTSTTSTTSPSIFVTPLPELKETVSLPQKLEKSRKETNAEPADSAEQAQTNLRKAVETKPTKQSRKPAVKRPRKPVEAVENASSQPQRYSDEEKTTAVPSESTEDVGKSEPKTAVESATKPPRKSLPPPRSTELSLVRKSMSEKPLLKRSRGPPLANSHITVESTYGVSSEPVGVNIGNFGLKNSTSRGQRHKAASGRGSNSSEIPERSSVVRGRNRAFKSTTNSEKIDDLITMSSRAPDIEQDVEGSQTEARPLVKPRKNSSSVYHFETGRLQRKVPDLRDATTNEVPDDKTAFKQKPQHVEPAPPLPPKKFSSRYRGPRPGAPKTYQRGNHVEEPKKEVEPEKSSQVNDRYRNFARSQKRNKQLIVPLRQEDNKTHDDQRLGSLQELETVEVAPGLEEEEAQGSEEVEAKADVHEEKEESKKEGGGNTKQTKGEGKEDHEDHHAVKGEKGDKGYKGNHHFDKGAKGFHDKEAHQGEYHDEKGNKKSHKEGGGHFEEGHHGEKGEKEAGHADKEEYKKGHSTRGGHVVHKKDEYEKKMEFYDEAHEGGKGEKFGAYFESHGGKKGGHKKGGHKSGGASSHHKGKKGKFMKGGHVHEDKGHNHKSGEDKKHAHEEKYGKDKARKKSKKWHYSTGPVKSGGGGGGGGGKKQALKEESSEEEETEALHEEAPEHEDHAGYSVDEAQDRSDVNVEEVKEVEDAKEVTKERLVEETSPKVEKSIPKNAEYLDEDGPTSFYTAKVDKEEAQRAAREGEGDDEVEEVDESQDVTEEEREESQDVTEDEEEVEEVVRPRKQPQKKQNLYMTEDDLMEDKEGDEGFKVLNHLHHEEDDDERSPRSYRVAEDVQESQRVDTRVKVDHSNQPIVTILSRYKLPPL